MDSSRHSLLSLSLMLWIEPKALPMPAKQEAAGFPALDRWLLWIKSTCAAGAGSPGLWGGPGAIYLGCFPVWHHPTSCSSPGEMSLVLFTFGDRVSPHSPGWPGAAVAPPSPAFSVKFTASPAPLAYHSTLYCVFKSFFVL